MASMQGRWEITISLFNARTNNILYFLTHQHLCFPTVVPTYLTLIISPKVVKVITYRGVKIYCK